ncbi:hypothetical protein PN836_015135 [Ningiella sp. W23]|uniref:hypothetical protein n=1 Tax=Ningiella sp. W23 TaxID=3023715 RepID=UPI00375671BE
MRFLLYLCFFISSFGASAKPIDITLVAIESDAPFAFVENEESKGLLIEIIETVSARLPNYNIHIKHLPWENIKNRDFDTPVDGFLGAYFRIDEWEDVYPYSYPIYHEQMCIVCSSKNTDSSTVHTEGYGKQWPADYSNSQLGTVRDYSGWFNYDEQARQLGSLNVFEFPDPRIALIGLHKGVVDCTLFEKTVFRSLTKSLTKSGSLPEDHGFYIATELERDSLHIAYFKDAIKGDKQTFFRDFDTAYAKALYNYELTPIFASYGVSH